MNFLKTFITQLSALFGEQHFEGVQTEAEVSAKLDDLKLENFKPITEMVAALAPMQEQLTALATNFNNADTAAVEMGISLAALQSRVEAAEQTNATLEARIVDLAKAQLTIKTSTQGLPETVGFIETPKPVNKNKGAAMPTLN
jgi:predicted  nucleic acid-binding Zn-ribbon protein